MKTYYQIYAYHQGDYQHKWLFDDYIKKLELYEPKMKCLQARYPDLRFKIIKITEEVIKSL